MLGMVACQLIYYDLFKKGIFVPKTLSRRFISVDVRS